jgi:hypothetical protein
VDDKRAMLRHFLAALAYRTQKALRGAPASFPSFRAAPRVRTPQELVRHMNGVLGYARTFFVGGEWRPAALAYPAEIRRFHEILEDLRRHLDSGAPLRGVTEEQVLQGPLADAMTHAGQLALLRRLAGSPVAPENFIFAAISSDNVGPDQAPPAQPDREWPDATER